MTTENLHLIVRLEGQVVHTLPLVQSVILIGRTPDNGLSLPHPQVSRQHAELRIDELGLTLTDLGSSSGTFIGGMQVLPHQPQPLLPSAVVRIGPFEISFDGPGVSAEESQPVIGGESAARGTVAPPAPLKPPRRTFPPPQPFGPYSRYLRDLPVIYHDSDFLGRYLQIFEAIWEPLEQRQDHIEMYFDPDTAPARFLPLLAQWLTIPMDIHSPESRQRDLLNEAMDMYKWRGTRYGLARIIQLVIGVVPEISDEPNAPFTIRVRVQNAPDQPIDKTLLEQTILLHKPAHIGYIIDVISE
ncbi:FHA domain-containing protein [Chloroflexia bacterium SDU3-3]|nr:FHA domain-containing protein [Chloroflexia bacterium SDU3-3]